MVVPACFLCGRRSRRFLSKFALEDSYICRLCENGLRCRKQIDTFPVRPDYGFRPPGLESISFQIRNRLVFCSHEELMQRYQDDVLEGEDGF